MSKILFREGNTKCMRCLDCKSISNAQHKSNNFYIVFSGCYLAFFCVLLFMHRYDAVFTRTHGVTNAQFCASTQQRLAFKLQNVLRFKSSTTKAAISKKKKIVSIKANGMKRKRVLLWTVEKVSYWRNIDKAQFLPGLYADGEFLQPLQSTETGFVPKSKL